MKRLTSEAVGIGCGLRFDDGGNAKATFRAILPADAAASASTATAGPTQHPSAPRLYDGDEFVMNGSVQHRLAGQFQWLPRTYSRWAQTWRTTMV